VVGVGRDEGVGGNVTDTHDECCVRQAERQKQRSVGRSRCTRVRQRRHARSLEVGEGEREEEVVVGRLDGRSGGSQPAGAPEATAAAAAVGSRGAAVAPAREEGPQHVTAAARRRSPALPPRAAPLPQQRRSSPTLHPPSQLLLWWQGVCSTKSSRRRATQKCSSLGAKLIAMAMLLRCDNNAPRAWWPRPSFCAACSKGSWGLGAATAPPRDAVRGRCELGRRIRQRWEGHLPSVSCSRTRCSGSSQRQVSRQGGIGHAGAVT
jgi:hypothetical protein